MFRHTGCKEAGEIFSWTEVLQEKHLLESHPGINKSPSMVHSGLSEGKHFIYHADPGHIGVHTLDGRVKTVISKYFL